MSKAAHLPAAVADIPTGRHRQIPASSASVGQVMADKSAAEELKLSHRLRSVEEGEALYGPPLKKGRTRRDFERKLIKALFEYKSSIKWAAQPWELIRSPSPSSSTA